jgi:alanine racemase
MPPLEDECGAAVEHDLTATLTRVEQVMQLQRQGERQGKVAHGHIYEDLGLGRLGPHDSIVDILQTAEPWPQVEVGGLYSHFGPPGSGVELDFMDWVRPAASVRIYAAMLFDALEGVTDRRLMFHVAASAMFLESPDYHFDMVRVGSLLYGQYPDHVPQNLRTLDLQDTWELRSRIVEVHTVERGGKVGYGGEFVCRRRTRVATVPVGFADGLGVVPESVTARPRQWGKALLRSWTARRGATTHLPQAMIGAAGAPIIGRISMDQCCLDVTDIPEADRGTWVTLPARRTTASPAIPRVYVDASLP